VLEAPHARLTLPAVAGRGLTEGLGHTEVRSIFGMVVMLPEPSQVEKLAAPGQGLRRCASMTASLGPFRPHPRRRVR
jgi:hypothetical protein